VIKAKHFNILLQFMIIMLTANFLTKQFSFLEVFIALFVGSYIGMAGMILHLKLDEEGD
jgi:uncharacterized membrane protein YczE